MALDRINFSYLFSTPEVMFIMNNTIPESVVQSQIKPRGFAAMTPEKRREISSEGGRAAHRSGKAHQFTSEEAREAGRKRNQRKVSV